MRYITHLAIVTAALAALATPAHAGIDPVLQARVQARMAAIRAIAADPAIVQAVKSANANTPADYGSMTQPKWSELSVLDPFVRAFTKNDAAAALKNRRTEEISEAFVSSANGCKVAFLSKPTNWSHRGMPKHEVPMTGKTWQGAIETDESSGVQQIQVAVPILDGRKPVGSLVVGLAISKLR